MSQALSYLLLFGAGLIAGTVNVLAGGGSFLTLPVLIFLGLPPTVANGTNRVAILVQNAGAVWNFDRHGVVDWSWAKRAALPALAGAALGTWTAVRIGDTSFQRILALLMAGFAVVILLDPVRRRFGGDSRATGAPKRGDGSRLSVHSGPGFPVAFFLTGVYGGFVQAGVGFVILAVTTLAGLDLVRGNALKVLVVLLYTPLALVLFAAAGKLAWGLGATLAAGNLLGGLLGSNLTVLKGHAWVKRVVVVTILLFAVKLWVSP